MNFIKYLFDLMNKKAVERIKTDEQVAKIIDIVDNDNDKCRKREFTKYASLYQIGDDVYVSMDTARIVYNDRRGIVKPQDFHTTFSVEDEFKIKRAFRRREHRLRHDFSKVEIK